MRERKEANDLRIAGLTTLLAICIVQEVSEIKKRLYVSERIINICQLENLLREEQELIEQIARTNRK